MSSKDGNCFANFPNIKLIIPRLSKVYRCHLSDTVCFFFPDFIFTVQSVHLLWGQILLPLKKLGD